MLMVIGSRQFDDAHQCAAYLGLVPVQHESGSSVKGRARLSKSGIPVIRAKLYMAAVVATRYNPDIKAQYKRLTSKGKSKMSAQGQRQTGTDLLPCLKTPATLSNLKVACD
jgi:transposase